jgi:hypothetical protein
MAGDVYTCIIMTIHIVVDFTTYADGKADVTTDYG